MVNVDNIKSKNKKDEYYLGLDMGTDSVGWAVTDKDYNIVKAKGKSLWGVRLFDSANTAEERRLFRTARRRNDRKKQRINLLQELLSEEICKSDPNFFLRMKESKFHLEDKVDAVKQLNTLFNDDEYTDKEHHQEFPTIYHLRKALMEDSKKYDIRLYYLAIHHIIKHRGHFLFEGQKIENAFSFKQIYSELHEYLLDEYNLDLQCDSNQDVEEILKDRSLGVTAKKSMFNKVFSKDTKMEKGIITALSGGTVKLSDLFEDESLSGGDITKVNFSDSSFEDKLPELESLLNERIYLINKLKAIYDWGILADILDGYNYLSESKVGIYEKHKKDLRLLKKTMKDSFKDDPEVYDDFFRNHEYKGANYVKYIGVNKDSGKKVAASGAVVQSDICKELVNLFKNINILDDDAKYILKEIESETFLPKQISKDNSVIPYQLQLKELELILHNMSNHYSSILIKDENGWSIKDKIIKLLIFKIPYYVGPLNDTHANTEDWTKGNCWIVKKSNERVLPWNFDEIVDKDASAERFIRRMTNKCTYLLGADVLPKDSLLYSEYMVLNELNNLKIDGERISPDIKKKIYDDVFKNKTIKGKVTLKNLKEYMMCEGLIDENAELSGVDIDFKSSLKSYHDFKKILGNKIENNKKIIEDIIQSIVLFPDDKKLLKNKISKKYAKELSEDEISQIVKLSGRYKDWGRFSREVLEEIYDNSFVNNETGEFLNIINALREHSLNYMELLGSNYGFKKAIEEYNNESNDFGESKINYDIVDQTYASPSVKRMIWQALLIVKEIRKVMGDEPQKIFVETTRSDGIKGDAGRKSSRKNQLIDLYKNCSENGLNFKKDEKEWIEGIENHSDNQLRGKKLYLYYTQHGRCMYSGDIINLSELNNKDLYDIDHIIPQSKTKDNSFDNMVLVKKECNQDKKDKYPIDPNIRNNIKWLWQALRKNKFISKEKYDRLTRSSPLSKDELAGFINRQLVETGQSTKLTCEILKKTNSDSKIVYSKAGNVSDFRREFGFIKVREINDYHHAKDAYLNIVVGNTYDVKFTQNPYNFIKKEPDTHYNLEKIFNWDVKRGDEVAWTRGKDGTIKTVDDIMTKNNILFTRYAYEKKGGLFDQMPVKKGKGDGKAPLKGSDERMTVEKYGGYNKISGAYFMLVESKDKKGKSIRTLEFVPSILAQSIKDSNDLVGYCTQIGIHEPKILMDKIKINSLIKLNGVPLHITGRTGDRIILNQAVQLVISKENEKYIKKLFNFLIKKDEKKKYKIELCAEKRDGLSKEENMEIYYILLNKANVSIYSKIPAMPKEIIIEGRKLFMGLSVENQALLLRELLKLFQCSKETSNILMINGSANSGKPLMSKKVSNYDNVKLINQSVTGLYEKELDLLKL